MAVQQIRDDRLGVEDRYALLAVWRPRDADSVSAKRSDYEGRPIGRPWLNPRARRGIMGR